MTNTSVGVGLGSSPPSIDRDAPTGPSKTSIISRGTSVPTAFSNITEVRTGKDARYEPKGEPLHNAFDQTAIGRSASQGSEHSPVLLSITGVRTEFGSVGVEEKNVEERQASATFADLDHYLSGMSKKEIIADIRSGQDLVGQMLDPFYKHLGNLQYPTAEEKKSLAHDLLRVIEAHKDGLHPKSLSFATGVVKSLISQQDVIETFNLKKSEYSALKNVNASKFEEQMHKMVIDLPRARSRFSFENENGYLNAMYRGLNYILQNLGTKFDASHIDALHSLATADVKMQAGEFVQGFRDGVGTQFPLIETTYPETDGNMTPEGRAEFLSSSKAEEGWMVIKDIEDPGAEARRRRAIEGQSGKPEAAISDKKDMQRLHLVLAPKTNQECKKKIDDILNVYYTKIGTVSTGKEALREIAGCCQNVDRHHVFSDGNVRTSWLLMNKLLIENNMTPTLLENPNVIDMFSLDQIVSEIEGGCAAFNRTFMER